eukprot:TRINITY_DN76224_c0_g1_i1.p1 TRINITY_DN76224_c0_g1~~TRINITY_DN76224_c0_g1_i1.p1  ORF type:complete len:211 (-),score=20.64 TRINITY_DN76224_c0_g1_i1:67-699(-)
MRPSASHSGAGCCYRERTRRLTALSLLPLATQALLRGGQAPGLLDREVVTDKVIEVWPDASPAVRLQRDNAEINQSRSEELSQGAPAASDKEFLNQLRSWGMKPLRTNGTETWYEDVVAPASFPRPPQPLRVYKGFPPGPSDPEEWARYAGQEPDQYYVKWYRNEKQKLESESQSGSQREPNSAPQRQPQQASQRRPQREPQTEPSERSR